MKNNRIYHHSLLALMLSILAIVSCAKENTDNSGNNPPHNEEEVTRDFGSFVVNSGVLYMNEQRCKSVTVVNDNTLRLANTLSAAYTPKVGDIVLCAQTPQTPVGFMGRVVSLNGDTYHFEDVNLEDVFETLSVDSTMDITTYLGTPEDEEGNVLNAELLDSSVWDSFDYDYSDEEESPETKATVNKVISVGIVNDFFEGQFYSSVTMDTRIRIEKGKLEEFHVGLSKRCGINGIFNVKKEKKKNFKLKSITFPLGPGIPVGPLVLRPMMSAETGIKLSGEVSLSGQAQLELENSSYSMDYRDGAMNYQQTSGENQLFFSLTLVEIQGYISPYIQGGVLVALFQKDLLSAGIEVTGSVKMEAETSISLENKQLLVENPTIKVTPQLEGTAYLTSIFLGKYEEEHGRIQVKKTDTFEAVNYPIFPTFSKGKMTRDPNLVAIDLDFDARSMMRPVETGVACFVSDATEPVVLLPLTGKTLTKATETSRLEYEGEASYAKPYVKIVDGSIYYGNRIGTPLLKKVTVYNNDNYSCSYEFEYDEQERLVKAKGDLYGNFRYVYSEHQIKIFTYDTEDVQSVWGVYELNDEGKVVRNITQNVLFKYDNDYLVEIGPESEEGDKYVFNGVNFTYYAGYIFTYSAAEDMFNLSIFPSLVCYNNYYSPIFLRMPGMWGKHLPDTVDGRIITYTMDNEIVRALEWDGTYKSGDQTYPFIVEYRFEYYE